MKTISYSAVHYGAPYLASAIRSVIDHVDEAWILYTAKPSYGFSTDLPCPDTRDQLYAIAQQAAGAKLRWHDGEWNGEGLHRDTIYQLAPDADVILVLDSDEIWPRIVVESALAWDAVRVIRVPMIHFWRSFYRAILHDPAYPPRVIYPKRANGETTQGRVNGFIAHMGYAQPPAYVRYKLEIHGHRNQLRDIDWYMREVYGNKERMTDLHPVGSDYWNVETVNPCDYLPEWMATHPYFGMDWIE